jgi:hypothetical protein
MCFDLRAIMITKADFAFPQTGRQIAWGGGKARMLNPDGFTSLFNPGEFPPGQSAPQFLKYTPGKLATGGALTSTLNPYLAFEKDSPRRAFGNAVTDTWQHAYLRIPKFPVEFGYAIDACWAKPKGTVIDPINDYPPEANCLEAYAVNVVDFNGSELISSGSAELNVEVFDHQGIDTISTVTAEAPDLFVGTVSLYPVETTGEDSALFSGEIPNSFGVESGEFPVLIRVTDVAEDPNLGEVDAWFLCPVKVGETGWARVWSAQAESTDDIQPAVTLDDSGNVYVTCPDSFPLIKFSPSGNRQWAIDWGNQPAPEGRGVAADGLGNVWLTGYFKGAVDFDPGSDTDIQGEGVSGAFLSKYDSSGEYQMSYTWSTVGGGNDIQIDNSDNVYVTGSFRGTIDFDPGDGEDLRDGGSNGYDAFLLELNNSGEFVRALIWGDQNISVDTGKALALDPSGDIFVAGSFSKTVDFDPGPAEVKRTAFGDKDMYIVKFNSLGELTWVKTWGSIEYWDREGIEDIALDEMSGDVYVGGYFKDPVDFDPSDSVLMRSSAGLEDAFLSKFDPDGSLVWVKTWGGGDSDEAHGVAVGPDGSVLVTGFFKGKVDFDPGWDTSEIESFAMSRDAFLSKFDSSGVFVYVRTWGGWFDDDAGENVALDSAGNIFLTGRFRDWLDFDPGQGMTYLGLDGPGNVFLIRLDSDGNW